MQDVFSLIQAIIPEVSDELLIRLEIMRLLNQAGSRIGRTVVANQVGLSERSSRTIINHMREQGLVDITQQGMTLTSFGQRTLESLQRLLTGSNAKKFLNLELKLRTILGVDHCRVVAGNGDIDEFVYSLLGKMTQEILMIHLPRNESIVAVTGGSTLAKVARVFDSELSRDHDITFVPTRGGFGGAIDIQSNTIGGIMAQQTNCRYVPLFVPENISQETSLILMQDPSIQRAVELSKKADCLLLSVGSAEVMAERRDISDDQRRYISDKEAVGEAFGVFFDYDGNEVLRYPRLGMQLEDIDAIPLLITIVAGELKANAIKAFYKIAPKRGWLICDEALANTIINGEYPNI